jgi:hypothetical protein
MMSLPIHSIYSFVQKKAIIIIIFIKRIFGNENILPIAN